MVRAQAGPAGNLTKRQRIVFDFIKDYIQTHGVSPSYEEIRRNFGFGSYNSVQKHLKQLVAKGFLKTPWDNQKRALTLVEPGPSTTVLPLLGRVAAGRPIEAIQNPETVEVPEMLLRGEDNFACGWSATAWWTRASAMATSSSSSASATPRTARPWWP